MDNGFKAKYAILKKMYGEFPEDSIEFVAYDHYGIPDFSKFKHVLLYVSADRGTYYHQKYLYDDVYKTTNGRWAGPHTDAYEHAYNKHTKIKPVKINFVESIAYPRKKKYYGREMVLSYPEPYFKIVGDSAFAVYGNYIEDLVTLTKTGVLTSRGFFEPTAQQEEDMVVSRQPAPRQTPPTADELKFLAFWNKFVASLNQNGLDSFKTIALDTLYVCDQRIPVNKFIDKCFNQLIDDEVRKRIVDKTKLEYNTMEIERYNLVTVEAKRKIMKEDSIYVVRQIAVTRSDKNDNPPTIYFDFIVTKGGYRLYEINHYWSKKCCL
jgi:hypothetical protein